MLDDGPGTERGWRTCRIEELGEVQAGKPKHRHQAGAERPYLRVANVFDGRIEVDDVLTMPFTNAQFERYRVRDGDVLLNEGQSLELVGRCSMYRGELAEPCAMQNALIRFRAGPDCLPRFAEQLFRWYQASGVFASIATQTTSIAHLGARRFGALEVRVPPLSEQRAIADILGAVAETIARSRAVLAQVERVKQAALQQLLTRGLPGRGGGFASTELGELPASWRVRTVDAIRAPGKYTCVGGPFGSSLSSRDYVPTGVPVIRGANLSLGIERFVARDFVYVSEDKADELARNLAYPGDVIVTQRGTLGQVGLIPRDAGHPRFVVSQSQMKLTPDPRVALAEYVYLYFSSPPARAQLERRAVATGVPHINLGIFKRWRLPVPPLDEQRELCRRGERIDRRIRAEQRNLHGLRALERTLMAALLGGELRVASFLDRVPTCPTCRI